MSQIRYTCQFSANSFRISDTTCNGKLFSKLETESKLFKDIENVGIPQLLNSNLFFIIPFGYEIDSIEILNPIISEYTLTNNIIPVQKEYRPCVGCGIPIFINDTSAIYITDAFYPQKVIGKPECFVFSNTKMLSLPIIPFKYNAFRSKLLFYTSFDLVIHLKPDNKPVVSRNLKKLRRNMSFSEKSILDLVENDSDYKLYSQPNITIDSIDNTNNTVDFFEYIVLSSQQFKNSSQSLIEWKRKKGLNAGFVDIADVLQHYSKDDIGNIQYNNDETIDDDAAKVRMYLKEAFENGAQWLLIVGDEDVVPVRKQTNLNNDKSPTDKYFGNFTGDWEVNGNGKYGELGNYGDKPYGMLELFVGRIPCKTDNQFNNWLKKFFIYEQNPGMGDSTYLIECMGIQGDEFQTQNDYSIFENKTNIFYNHTLFQEYESCYSSGNNLTGPEPASIISNYNMSPPYMWIWLEHGFFDEVQTMSDGLNISNRSNISSIENGNPGASIANLSNNYKPGIVYSAACYSAAFEKEISGISLCLAESYLVNKETGGVCFLGGTNALGAASGPFLFTYFSNNIQSIATGNYENLTHFGTNYFNWMDLLHSNHPGISDYFIHNLFGDPESRFFTKIPTRLSATVSPRYLPINSPTDITIAIDNIGSARIVNVSLYGKYLNNGQPIVQTVTGDGSSSVVTFNNVMTSQISPLFVTISGFNYLPFTDNILVSPGCTFVNSPESIMSTQTMPFQYFKDHDIVVETGVTLTITGELYFVPQAKLIVKPGARLVLDGGTIGSSCNSLWQGVEVWGKYNLPQNILNQGVIEIKNNGCITNAECAIKAYNPKASNPTTTSGGIVAIRKAKFINNKCCIALYPLYNTANIYNSYIQNSIFSIDNNYMLQSGYPTKMIALEGFKSVNIEGCTFSNTNQKLEGENRGNAISATNAGMKINKLCIEASPLGDCITYSPMVFNGWHYAIHTNNCNPNHVIEIVNSSFYSNLRGIYLSSVSLPKIQRNTFKTIKRNQFEPPSSGLYLNACTGYSVQENTFDGNYAGTNTYETGIVINNSGTALNEIYNNMFTGLQNGITAQDDNRGLVCKCNDYAGVKTDQSVLITGGSSSTIGIALYQGDSLSVTGLAGNTFSQRSIGSGTYDLFNQGARFKYYHHANTPTKRLEPNPQLCTNVYLKQWNAYPYDKITSCPSKLNSGGSGLEEMQVELQSTSTSVQQKETELQALVDGGTTEQTTEDIIYSIPPEALTLRDELLTKSPYLSDTVMQSAAANEFVLPNVMIRDILVANPQSASSEQVLSELDKRIEPMPEDLYNQILDAEAAYSPLEIREMKLASLKAKQTWLFNSVVAHYLSDTTGSLGDSLNVVLQNAPFPEGRYLLALKQMAEKDTTAADSTLQAISSSFELSDEQQVILNDFLTYFEILKVMNRDTLPGTETDSIQTASLLALMSNVHEPVKSYIRNILIANEVITYAEPYLYADELKTSRIRKPNLINNEGNAMLQISPIPATDYFIVKFDLNNQIAPATLEVVSIYGQVLLSKQLNKYTDQFVVPLTGFSPGIYIVSIRVRDQVLDNCRLIVVK